MNLQPILNNIIVKVVEQKKATDAGILLTATEDNLVADVIVSGPGEWEGDRFVSFQFKFGDQVLLKKNAGEPFTFEGKEYLLITPYDIIARM